MKKKISILGGGESGTGAAILADKKDWKVFLSDKGQIKQKYKNVLKHIEFEEGKHSEDKILRSDLIVKSPGIPDHIDLIKKIKRKGIPIISEIEFAYRYCQAKIIGITGSNGKTTTTLLTWHILNKAGLNTALAGNIGKSFALQLAENQFDYYVLELSSFQLDDIKDFKADIAVILNITPDHLDRYQNNFQNYVDAKFKILNRQTKNDLFIYNDDDPVIKKGISNRDIQSQSIPFSIQHKILGTGACLHQNDIEINNNTKILSMTLESLALQGRHNIYNSMAASIIGSSLGIRNEMIKESLIDFKNIEHRLEYVATIHGNTFINDSKATNVNSTWYALESQSKPIIWIAGGIDKGNDYSLLKNLVREKVKMIISLGDDNEKLVDAFKDEVDEIAVAHHMDEAVNLALLMSSKGDTTLLSPACASFNMFENFEDRGNKFKEAVMKL